ncbi:short-chain dehydrogenase/reductase-like protein SDR [Phaeosphaeria sp. MPI-PUGE-AT-0046c]|nr:short-chain dehydrogenase/reductase-like protein SDR [Phaeosphaeria sp. MPI-PUGE-AT-0046c]
MAPYTLPPSAVWFITGCSSGIGHALCAHLATHTSHRIVATARDTSSLDALPSSPNILKLQLDVTSESSLSAAVAAVLEKWGRVDVVVNNAGYGMHTHTELADVGAARRLMDTNFWSVVRITQLMLPVFRTQTGPRGGLFVQMSSMGGRQGFPGGAFYHASKFALEGFTEAVMKECPEEWGVKWLIVEPGGVKTNYKDTSIVKAKEAEQGVGNDEAKSVYDDPKLPTNMLKQYILDPEKSSGWASVEKVVEVLYGVVERGGEMPLRLPLGSDSWGMQVKGAQESLDALMKAKEVACSTSGEEHARSVDFLTKEIRG